MLISAGGKVTPVAADDVPLQGRRTQGKRLVKVAAGDPIVEVTRAAGEGAQAGGEGARRKRAVEAHSGDEDEEDEDALSQEGQLNLLGE